MSYGQHLSHYREADVFSRSPEWLVPLLYEHLLSRLHRAAVQIEERDFEGKADSLSRASDIVIELLTTIDEEKGGELTPRLQALYAYFHQQIGQIGLSLDLDQLRRLIAMISELHEAWTQAAQQVAPRRVFAESGALAKA